MAIGEALKVNTSLTKIYFYLDMGNKVGFEGRKAIVEALTVNTSCEWTGVF